MSVPSGNTGRGGGSRELHTWKEIGEYLSVTPRTAQAWEQERGLPVHRLPGGRGRVIAYTGEIDEWKRTVPVSNGAAPNGGKRWGRIGIGVGLAIGVVAALIWAYLPRSGPGGFRVDGSTLVALDKGGKDLWRYPIPNQYHYTQHRTSREPQILLTDLDSDGRSEVLVNVEANEPSPDRNALLICLSPSGSELWRFAPGRHVRSPVDEFPLPYRIPDFALIRTSPEAKPKIVVSSHHLILYANQVALLDAMTGRIERQYWHSGALQRLVVHDADADGRPEIYLGGIHNGSKQAVLVVLDPETMDGASVEGNPEYQLAGFAPGREIARVYFPASCHTRKLGQYNVAASLKPESGGIEVAVWDPVPGADHVVHHYLLNADLSLRRMIEGDNYLGIHNSLRLAGFIDHDLTEGERDAKRAIQVVRPGQAAPARR
ncbi:MAG: hypothetical protein IH602_12425 [Bryobacteraceae bacterium]|nr:hypothetical protein [Bryobacteraceae bacterium]